MRLRSAQLRFGFTILLVVLAFMGHACNSSQAAPSLSPVSDIVISSLTVASPNQYQVVNGGLAERALVHTDRTYAFTKIPPAYLGFHYIRAANDDKSAAANPFLSFGLNRDARVYVAYQNDHPRPLWLGGWTDTGDDITADAGSLGTLVRDVLFKDFPAGTVSLGGNEFGGNMYSVIVGVPLSTIPLSVLSADDLGLGKVKLVFNKKLIASGAQNTDNYQVFSADDPQYSSLTAPVSAQLGVTPNEVVLGLPVDLSNGSSYTVTVNNLVDTFGNLIPVNSQISFSVSILQVVMNVDASTNVYPFRSTMRGVATNNWNWIWHGLMVKDNACCTVEKRNAIIDATKLLKPGVIRFAGGLWANGVGWDRNDIAPSDGLWTFSDPETGQQYAYEHAYDRQMVDSFADFARQVGAEAMVQVNMCDNNPKMWADMVKYTNVDNNYDFRYWEFANELSLTENWRCLGENTEPVAIQEYIRRYRAYRNAMLTVDPTIVFMGPVAHQPAPGKQWEDALFGDLGTELDVLVWHWYQLTEWTSNTGSFAYQGGSVDALLAHDGNVGTSCQDGFGCTIDDNIAPDRLGRWTYRRGIAEAKMRYINDNYRNTHPALETAITEFGVHASGHENPINSNHIAAIWLADVLPRWAYNGLDIVTYYSLEDGSTGGENSRGLMGIWHNESLDIRPIYYTAYLFGQYFGDMMVQSSTSDPYQKVVVWASKDSADPGALKLMLVNLTGTLANASINIAGFDPVVGHAYVMSSTDPLSLASPSSFTQHKTTINGHTIPDYDISNPAAFQNAITSIPSEVVAASSNFSYSIPAYSVVALVLRDSGESPPPSPTPTPTPGPDITPPVLSSLGPSGTLAAGTTQATLSLSTDEAATCKYGASAGTAYTSLPLTFSVTGGTSHSATVSGLQDGTSLAYYVRCQDAAGNANISDAPISFSVAAASSVVNPHEWPAKVDLGVGESYIYTLRDGSQRTLKLLSYSILIPRHLIEATVQVSGGGKTETHTLEVAYAGVPVSINGLRVYAYVWKEANDFGFEAVGFTGAFPLTAGKDVGFAVSDAKYTMYPDMGSYTYPVDIAFFEGGDTMQTFLEPTSDDTAWAHSGHDIKVFDSTNLIAMVNGTVWYQLGSDRSQTGQLWISASTGDKWGDPVTWLWTHVGGGTATVPQGTFVTKGMPLAKRRVPGGGFHMGSKNSFDFGSWLFPAEIWNYEHRDDYPAPRYWLVLGPYAGEMNSKHIAVDESGNISDTILPKEDGAVGGKQWAFRDNFVSSVVHMGELVSESPFSGNPDQNPRDSVAYAATYIYSPQDDTTDNTVHLKWGSSDSAKVWLNGQSVLDKLSGPLIIDELDVALPLRQGWNTLIVKTSVGSGAWRFSSKIGDSNGNRILGLKFSTRDIDLKVTSVGGNSIGLNWSAPGFYGTHVETYKLDVAIDASFANPVVLGLDIGKVTNYTLTGLAGEQEYFVRVRPYNYSEMGGSTYWEHFDTVSAKTTGKDKVLPSTFPPSGLSPAQVPQFVTIGSDDNNEKDGVNFLVNELFGPRTNPIGTGNPLTYDGTPALGTFYLIGQHETFASGLCESHRNAYVKGHEIGNHGYYGTIDGGGGRPGTSEGWRDTWIVPTNNYLTRKTGCNAALKGVGVPTSEIYGFRTPQDQYNSVLFPALEETGFTYHASTAVGWQTQEDGTNLPWPGTLDEGFPMASWQRVTGNHPGFWEVPQNVMVVPPELGGGKVGYCDSDWFWKWRDETSAVKTANIAAMLKYNLDLRLNGNRAPLHLCIHGNLWGKTSQEPERLQGALDRQAAIKEFLDYALSKPEVRVVRQIDVINWMRNPVSLGTAPDASEPSPPTGLTATSVSESRINLTWGAADDPESGVSSYNVYRDGTRMGLALGLNFSDTGLTGGTSYTYEVSAVNGVGLEGPKSGLVTESTLSDTTSPTIRSVAASGDGTRVTIVFSEPVGQTTATNSANYSIGNGITITSASLGSGLKTVALTTSVHTEGVTYRLTVNNVSDRATVPNSIAPNTQVSYIFVAQVVITDLVVASGKTYEVVEGGLNPGALVYIDRSYTFSSVPLELAGASFIKTANEDKAGTDEPFVSFMVNQRVTVYVAYDSRANSLPGWLSTWTDTTLVLPNTDLELHLYSRDYIAGAIELGGNLAAGASGAKSNYSVIVVSAGGSGSTGLDFPTLPGMSAPAQDLNGDGFAEDVNGNGRFDFADIVGLFSHLDSAAVQNNHTAFDYNTSGVVDMADVVMLFDMLLPKV